ncbi:MAG: hypothetical protein Q9Q13_05310, partial [Acidobacteriota bacterium]|nr:hypothetical protein [Acidobacteriota bacterium]
MNDRLARWLGGLFPGTCLFCDGELPPCASFSACPACWLSLPPLPEAGAAPRDPPGPLLAGIVAPFRYEGDTVVL